MALLQRRRPNTSLSCRDIQRDCCSAKVSDNLPIDAVHAWNNNCLDRGLSLSINDTLKVEIKDMLNRDQTVYLRVSGTEIDKDYTTLWQFLRCEFKFFSYKMQTDQLFTDGEKIN